MIAYRLHYELFNMKVTELCRQKALGELRTFVSSNGQDTQAPNIRLNRELGGGPVATRASTTGARHEPAAEADRLETLERMIV